MRRASRAFAAALIVLVTTSLPAQDPRLGRIDFPTSGRAEAKPSFIRGVLYLHSFEYDSAARYFRQAQRIDSNYAMAYWGEAMTYTHPIWHEQDAAAARAVLNRLAPTREGRRARAATAREKGWLDAIEVLYGEGGKEQRDTLYSAEMQRLANDFPGDPEIRSFLALSLLGLPATGRDVATYMRAAALAEEVFRENPEHPGALHYLIHAYDDPVHAPLGLRVARLYGDVAPNAAHAQHMTSHIFVSMGMWDDVERANIAAWEASERRNGHYTQWLSYSYLQKGRLGDARRYVQAIIDDTVKDATFYKLSYMNVMLAGYLIDAEDWVGPLARYAADSATRAGRGGFSVAASALDLAVGMAAARQGDTTSASAIHAAMSGRASAVRLAAGNGFVPGLAASEVMADLLKATILLTSLHYDSAIVVATAAAEREATLPFEFGPPETVKPPYELLGELLLIAQRPKDARVAFERSLARTPNRSRGVLGLARAHAATGNLQASAQYYARFLANVATGDSKGSEVREAEAFLATAEQKAASRN